MTPPSTWRSSQPFVPPPTPPPPTPATPAEEAPFHDSTGEEVEEAAEEAVLEDEEEAAEDEIEAAEEEEEQEPQEPLSLTETWDEERRAYEVGNLRAGVGTHSMWHLTHRGA